MRNSTVDTLIEKNGKILLITRGRSVFIGKKAIPGGRVDENETIEQAAAREAEEETGLEVIPKEILGVYSDPKRDPREQYIGTVFICEIKGGELKAGDDASKAEWVELNEINENEMAFDHFKIIQDYKKWKNEKSTYWSTK